MSTFFETKEDFAKNLIKEDNVLYQLRNSGARKEGNSTMKKKIVFTGDHIWLDMFGEYLDEEIHYPSYNVRDLDTNDKNVHQDILKYLADSKYSREFDLLVCHLLGIDHAGHTFGA